MLGSFQCLMSTSRFGRQQRRVSWSIVVLFGMYFRATYGILVWFHISVCKKCLFKKNYYYYRDIFPPVNEDCNDQRLIRLVIFNDKDATTQKVIQDWDRKNQSSATLASELALARRPEISSNKFGNKLAKEKLRTGIRSALEILTELTEAQKNVQERIINRGRIVCLTFLEDLKAFTETFNNLIHEELQQVISLNFFFRGKTS